MRRPGTQRCRQRAPGTHRVRKGSLRVARLDAVQQTVRPRRRLPDAVHVPLHEGRLRRAVRPRLQRALCLLPRRPDQGRASGDWSEELWRPLLLGPVGRARRARVTQRCDEWSLTALWAPAAIRRGRSSGKWLRTNSTNSAAAARPLRPWPGSIGAPRNSTKQWRCSWSDSGAGGALAVATRPKPLGAPGTGLNASTM
jgi:hypothetical protein